MNDIAEVVYHFLELRGYGIEDRTVEEAVKAYFLKAVEEMGEVARHVFDGMPPPPDEIADVMIPFLGICALLGYDFQKEVLEKVTKDVKRGVRNATEPV